MDNVLNVIVVLLTYCGCLCNVNQGLTKPCDAQDLDCLGVSTVNFLEQTSNGIPQYNIKAIDPMKHPLLEVKLDKDGIKQRYTNVTVTGMKNLRLEDFTMNTDYGAVVLKTKVDLKFSSRFEVDFYKPENKQFSGSVTATGKAITISKYFYNTVNDDKGVAHFDVGPEIIECTPIDDPIFKFNEEMKQQMANDADISEDRTGILLKEETRKIAFCTLIKAIYPTVIHNIRAAAKILPKAAFIKNV